MNQRGFCDGDDISEISESRGCSENFEIRRPCIIVLVTCKHFLKPILRGRRFNMERRKAPTPHVEDRGKGRHNIALAIYGQAIFHKEII